MMPRSRFIAIASLVADLSLTAAFSEPVSPTEPLQLKRIYNANEWHMRRFMKEYLSQEEHLRSDPNNDRLKVRLDTLKNQIDVLTRENERILNTLDEMREQGR